MKRGVQVRTPDGALYGVARSRRDRPGARRTVVVLLAPDRSLGFVQQTILQSVRESRGATPLGLAEQHGWSRCVTFSAVHTLLQRKLVRTDGSGRIYPAQ